MRIKSLALTNYRNFPSAQLSLTPVNLFLGRNAQGKSNILEAIYFLATTKSPRAEKDFQLVKEGEGFSLVSGEFINEQEELNKLEVSLNKANLPEGDSLEKRVKVNGVPKRTIDYIGNLVVVYFVPEDINLVTGSPSLRRWFLDLSLAQIDRGYKKAINNYSIALSARNRILKKIQAREARVDELEFWSGEIVASGQIVSAKRREFLEEVSRWGDSFSLDYQESEITAERLKSYLPKELLAGVSLIGPHRDDFVFLLSSQQSPRLKKNLGFFGSRGEQRTAVLDLKLAQLQFVLKQSGKLPVLLLDDVFSELDTSHRRYIADQISKQQVILSAVESENIPEQLLKNAQVFKVEEGKLLSPS